MAKEKFPEITRRMASAIRGYSFTMEEARELADRFRMVLKCAVVIEDGPNDRPKTYGDCLPISEKALRKWLKTWKPKLNPHITKSTKAHEAFLKKTWPEDDP
jgi:hypothetical protein